MLNYFDVAYLINFDLLGQIDQNYNNYYKYKY